MQSLVQRVRPDVDDLAAHLHEVAHAQSALPSGGGYLPFWDRPDNFVNPLTGGLVHLVAHHKENLK